MAARCQMESARSRHSLMNPAASENAKQDGDRGLRMPPVAPSEDLGKAPGLQPNGILSIRLLDVVDEPILQIGE